MYQVTFENGCKMMLIDPDIKTKEQAEESALQQVESITGKPRDKLVRVVKVEECVANETE